MAQQSEKIAKASVEASASSSLNVMDPLLEEPLSVTHTTPPIAIPLPSPPHPDGALQHHKRNWKHWTRALIFKPSVWVLIVLMTIAAISFCALLSNPEPLGDPTLDILPFDYSGSDLSLAVGPQIQPESDLTNCHSQCRVYAETYQFDWLKPHTVSVRWFIKPGFSAFPNTTIDIYFDEWVQTKLSVSESYSTTKQQHTGASLLIHLHPKPFHSNLLRRGACS